MDLKSFQIISVAAICIGLTGCAATHVSKVTEPSTGRAIDIYKNYNIKELPKPDLAKQKIYFSVKDSPKGSRILQEDLKKRGFQVVDTPEQADARFEMDGMIIVASRTLKQTTTRLGMLMERSIKITEPNKIDYHRTDVSNLPVIFAGKALTGAFHPFYVVQWLIESTGIRAGLNQLLTGDPTGACIGENCDKYFNIVTLIVTGKDERWVVRGEAKDDKLILDTVLTDMIDTAMKPIYNLSPNAPKIGAPYPEPQK